MTPDGCFRRLEIKVGSCCQCTFFEHVKKKCEHPEMRGNRKMSMHNILYIVPIGCPLDMWEEKHELKRIEDIEKVELNNLWD